MTQDDPHADVTVTCRGHLNDDSDGHDAVELTWDEHGRYLRSTADLRVDWEGGALVFTCPECGHEHTQCPVCTDPDDNQPAGWFRGESTGEAMPCHNCNQQEIAQRRKHHGHSGRMGSRRRRGNGDEDLPPEAFM